MKRSVPICWPELADVRFKAYSYRKYPSVGETDSVEFQVIELQDRVYQKGPLEYFLSNLIIKTGLTSKLFTDLAKFCYTDYVHSKTTLVSKYWFCIYGKTVKEEVKREFIDILTTISCKNKVKNMERYTGFLQNFQWSGYRKKNKKHFTMHMTCCVSANTPDKLLWETYEKVFQNLGY